jgi:hypothetical protein
VKEHKSSLLRYYAAQTGIRLDGRPPVDLSIRSPRVFSLIDNPEESLRYVERVVRAALSGVQTVRIDQSRCGSLDLCAGGLLNAMAIELADSVGTRFGGAYPTTREALEIVVATGLPKALGIPLPELPTFLVFEARTGGDEAGPDRRSRLQPSRQETVAGQLTGYLAACFRQYDINLELDARSRLGHLVGEVLINASDHAGGHRWFVSAYLRQPSENDYGDAHITIFNFGPTMAETLQRLLPGDLRTDIEQLLAEHRKRSYFTMVGPRWTEEGLWTLYALQEGVSSKASAETARGVGTADMIEEFQILGRTEGAEATPKMCLLSGHTHILFDGRYKMRPAQMADGSARRIIAFNTENDLWQPPDLTAIRHLDHRFPGTLLSIRFYLDPRYLKTLTGTYVAQSH